MGLETAEVSAKRCGMMVLGETPWTDVGLEMAEVSVERSGMMV